MAGKITPEIVDALARRLHSLFYNNAPHYGQEYGHELAWVELPDARRKLYEHVAYALAGDIFEAARHGR
jgi:hypothetical protein